MLPKKTDNNSPGLIESLSEGLGIPYLSDEVWGGITSMVERRTIGGNYAGNPYAIIWSEMRELLNTVLGLQISDNPTPYDKMTGYMYRHMLINMYERSLTISNVGVNAYTNGNPDTLGINAYVPAYAHNSDNYLDFVAGLKGEEPYGVNSTRSRTTNGISQRDDTVSLFPDDLDRLTGEPSSLTWQLTNKNSILTKTKKLFQDKKINSLISRFGTGADQTDPLQYNGKVGYNDIGSSRGRNLKRVNSYTENGYNNPYCRVWTHHYQYDKLDKMIRPFNGDGGNIKKLHTWNNANFKPSEQDKEEAKNNENMYFWKNENEGWNHSVLSQQDGRVNITPKYGVGSKTIHTKDCMFSIENLAWRDCPPVDFDNALSWEQRGPLGGRIMWFPPYGLSITDNTNVSWNSATFIGRGENVYTYSNTERTGNITFYMLTDHPSITDYASWSADSANDIEDEVWLRFFAGCDSLDGSDPNSLLYYVKPTPKDLDITYNSGNKPEENVTAPEKPQADEPSESIDTITFFTFFPNNYSGNTDKSVDFSIAYLLAGSGAQRNFSEDKPDEDIDISFDDFKPDSINGNRGYEMVSNLGISDSSQTNIIKGCKTEKQKENNGWAGVGDKYVYDESKIWRYRIDGGYVIPTETDTMENSNCENCSPKNIWVNDYAQKIINYSDSPSGKCYNSDSNNIPEVLKNGITGLYSFAEFAYAVAIHSKYNEGMKQYLENTISINSNNDRINNLIKLLDNEVESIDVSGYANSQGYEICNNILAKSRGNLIKNWVRSKLNVNKNVNIESKVENINDRNENSEEAKIWRYARCTIKFKTESTEAANVADGDYSNVSDEQVQTVAKETNTPYNTLKGILSQTGIFEEGSDFMNTYNEIMNKQKEPIIKTTGLNKTRYDNEMFFYKKFAKDNPFVFKKLTEKLQYFDPGFHSMTPEGYNERLTFLHQCCRQGNTISTSDASNNNDTIKATTASNMAFGRPPFCVLRLGDFYNQMIIIRDMTITFDESNGMTWDMNDEGIGMQPMLAKISLNIVFIGGGDMRGPVRRLQNAMSFNYYANASLYDNRADRVAYDATMNLSQRMGMDNYKFETDTKNGVYFYTTPMKSNE